MVEEKYSKQAYLGFEDELSLKADLNMRPIPEDRREAWEALLSRAGSTSVCGGVGAAGLGVCSAISWAESAI